MAVVDPYSPCPCGSGQKFKWCCHKLEPFAERAARLIESGQNEAAIHALDEGLRKEPGNAWLLTRKALYLIRNHQIEPAKEAVRLVLAKNPKHAGAQLLMTRLVLETEGPAAGAAQLQQAMTAFPREGRHELARLVKVVGAFLSEAAEFPAALRHLRLAQALDTRGEPDPSLDSSIRAIEGNPGISPWQKNPDVIAPPPEALSDDLRERFAQAVGWAEEGLWSSAAAAFETLTSDPVAGPLAARNLGFCRLWLADHPAAVAALRRYVSGLGATAEAVDIEALCQQIATPSEQEQVENVQLNWPLRDRQALLDALKADRSVQAEEQGPIDPDDPDSPEVDQFALLDRPELERAEPGLSFRDVPRIVGRVHVGEEIAALETFDDGRLDGLSERFTALAGSSIAPAHPRTKILGKVSRLQLGMMWEWLLPDGIDPAQTRRLTLEQGQYVMDELWPSTPNPAFGGRSPLQAGEAGDAAVPLRAAVFQLECSREDWRESFDFAALRARLRIGPEPEIDPDTVDVAALHLARLSLVPADRLSDEKLVTFHRRVRQASLDGPLEKAAHVLVERPGAMERFKVETLSVYTDLAALASVRGRTEESFEWVRRGRQADPPARRGPNAPSWDMFEIRLRSRTESPETWVFEIAVILERYRNDPTATQVVILSLIDMGLLDVVPNSDRPGEILLDSRPLQALLAEFGPRLTTASGHLGVSATRPEIWTPGGASSGGSGGLWTPGSSASPVSKAPPGGEKKLFAPGR